MSKWNTHRTCVRVRNASFALMIICLLTGCIGDKASKNAKEWYRAINSLDGLRADELTCSTRWSEVQSWMALGRAFLGLGQTVAGDLEIDVDISGVSFQTIENYDGQAIVAVHGEYRGAVGGIVSTDVIDERWLMIVEDGTWKWCGYIGAENSIRSQEQVLPTSTKPETVTDSELLTSYESATQKIKSIRSFRYTADEISKNYEENTEESLRMQAEVVSQFEFRETRETSDKQVTEVISIPIDGGTKICNRQDFNQWDCHDHAVFGRISSSPFDNKTSMWRKILGGNSIRLEAGSGFGPAFETVDSGFRKGIVEGEDCLVFYFIEEAKVNTRNISINIQLCLNPSTYLPSLLTYTEFEKDDGGVIRSCERIEHYSGFNEDFIIAQPIP